MEIGIPREIKAGEGRVALLPAQVKTLADAGHVVRVEAGAGAARGGGGPVKPAAGVLARADAASLIACAATLSSVSLLTLANARFIQPFSPPM